MNVGRVVGGALLGMLFLLFVALDLVLFGVLPLNSVMVTVFPVVGLVVGGALGYVSGTRHTPG